MTTPILIYCAGGNQRFAEIAIRRGYKYGACLPATIYYEPYFTDQDWRKFKIAKTPERRQQLRSAYMCCVESRRPSIATVLDWEHEEQYPEVMSWAEEAAQWVDTVIIIPKVPGQVHRIPHEIGGKSVRLGYSAASNFSGTPVTVTEFQAWNGPVHCLGGSPAAQMHFNKLLPVVTADGNFIQQLARSRAQFYSPNRQAKRKGWPTLREAGFVIAWDAPYYAFELTCIAVPMAWQGCSGREIWATQLAYMKSIGCYPVYNQSFMEGFE